MPPASTTFSPNAFFVAPDGDDAYPGTLEQPWASPVTAARRVQAGQTVYLRGGLYPLVEQVRIVNAGTADGWITFAALPGEQPVLDFIDWPVGPPGSATPHPHDQGAFQIEGVAYVRVEGITLRNSHAGGICIRDSRHVDIVNNLTDTTFSPGIAAWDSDHDSRGTEHIRILGNRVTHANTHAMIIPGFNPQTEAPHEAISLGGVQHFEVAYNHLFDCDKEGIDVKEVSKHGRVHHNRIERVDRQGLYVDAWFGAIEDIEFDHNVVLDCRGAGLVFSVENGEEVRDVRAHHNLLANNLGTGIFFSRWGDGPRRNLIVERNTVVHNGHGQPKPGERFFWITGGLYLFSANLQDVIIRDNVFSDNCAFEIGYSEHYLAAGEPIERVLTQKGISISHNLVDDRSQLTYPVRAGWPDNYANVWSYPGEEALLKEAVFSGEYGLSDVPGLGWADEGEM